MSRPIDKIIIHCSDSPDSNDKVDAAEIARWHKLRGFKMIGYHYVILRNGVIELGRSTTMIGAHCKGHNLTSIGICWVGRDEIDREQVDALLRLIYELLAKYKLPVSAVKGHHEFDNNKTCPNLNMDDFRRDIDDYIKGNL